MKYLEVGTAEYPEGSECPVHHEVHGAHGWYVCLPGERETWGWRDKRTGKRVSQSATFTREQAERELEGWLARDRRGGRPDLHDTMPYVEVYRIYPPEESHG